jgi:hypothetical protein
MRKLGILAIAALLAATPVWAAKKKKRSKDSPPPALEVYSATEADGPVTRAMPTAMPAPKEFEVEPKRLSAPKVRKAVAFDAVPVDQTDALVRRLELVQQLIRDYGRAYDYRALTVRQLEGILEALENSELAPIPPSANNS